jgi:hypothetical protein
VAQQDGTPWGDIDVTAPAVAHLAYATLQGGGTGPHDGAPFAGASLAAQSSDATRPVALRLDSVTIDHSAGLGLFLRSVRLDPASSGLTISGAGWYPAYLGAGSASELPAGSYTGNAIDQILLQTFNTAAYDDSAPIRADVTLHDRGVPYRVGTIPSRIVVGDGLAGGPAASLTVEAGVTVLFTPQGAGGTSGILVNARPAGAAYQPQGALVIAGTAAAPVVLDSAAATPAAGDWQGVYVAHIVDPRTSIDHARILHAGGASGTVGICGSTPAANNGAATCAVVAFLDQAPPASFLANTDIEDATCGVYRGWSKTDVDFTSGNQFVGVVGCTQTAIADSGGHCTTCTTAP